MPVRVLTLLIHLLLRSPPQVLSLPLPLLPSSKLLQVQALLPFLTLKNPLLALPFRLLSRSSTLPLPPTARHFGGTTPRPISGLLCPRYLLLLTTVG